MTGEVRILHGDSMAIMENWRHKPVDLVFTSPPYEDARVFPDQDAPPVLKGEAWVEWCVKHFVEATKICNGLVAYVVEGRTKNFEWSGTPIQVMADLKYSGVVLRKPPIFYRAGLPGSGGPDWLRNDYEFIVCGTRWQGKLPWSDNTAMGKPPKYKTGGSFSNRKQDGTRTSGRPYPDIKIANPGNVIHCKVGKGHMGSNLAHKNEAPFPESLAEFFIRSFCPPGGTVLDPFCGSGTTLAVAARCGRNAIGIDIRKSQVNLSSDRMVEVEQGE